jgi:uncharacterized membrane protein
MAFSPPGGWLRWALVASLGLNLVFVGLIAGALVKGPPPPPAPGISQYARALPEPYRRELGRGLRSSRSDWSGMRAAWRGRRAALADSLTAEPFDLAAVAALLDEERRLAGELATRGADLLLDEIGRMSPDERAAFAAALTEHRHGRDGRRH